MHIRRSVFDPSFWEVVLDDTVIQEIKIEFSLRDIPKNFADLEAITTWLSQTEYKLSRKAALRLLARKSYSKAMLLQKLKEKRFSQKTCEKVIEEIEKLGYLSDHDYARALIDQKVRQGYGPHMIKRFLQEKGLNTKDLKIDAKTQAASLQKWAHKLRAKDTAKKTAFLLRKGFDLESVRRVLDPSGHHHI